MKRIKKLTIQNTQHGRVDFEVGSEIKEIRNCGLEFEDSVHSSYDVFNHKDEIVFSIENCAVVVEYFTD